MLLRSVFNICLLSTVEVENGVEDEDTDWVGGGVTAWAGVREWVGGGVTDWVGGGVTDWAGGGVTDWGSESLIL